MDQIATLLDRPKDYCNIDGVGELGVGFMCLGYTLIQWLQVHSPWDSVWNQIYTLYIWIGVMCAVIHYGTKAIKKRITYPRTGFVEYRRRDWLWRPMIIGAAVSALGSASLFIAIRKHWDMTMAVSLSGLVFAAAYAYGFARTVPWKWVVVWVMAAGSLVITALPANVVGALAKNSWLTKQFPAKLVGACLLTMALYGLATLISGGISFWLYLRHTEAPAQES